MREIKGQLHRISSDFRLFSVQIVNKLEFFYLQPRFVKQFRKYLYPGVFIQFTVEENKFKYRRRLTSKVTSFEQILGNRYRRSFSYFDQRAVRQQILEKIENYSYRLFLDLEMTMQYNKAETDEIIQVGAILVDQTDRILFNYSTYIKPTEVTFISKRTLEFLNVRPAVIKNGIPYDEFYNQIHSILQNYNPAVIVWGTNDLFALEHSYTINRVKPLFSKSQAIDLQKVLKQFYNINYELGLFQTAQIYRLTVGEQKHNAYHDARIMRSIFNQFYNDTKADIVFEFKKELLSTI